MKKSLVILALLGLAACEVEDPATSGLEVVAPLPGTIAAPRAISEETIDGPLSYVPALTPEAKANQSEFVAVDDTPDPLEASPANGAPTISLSDENSFDAVSTRESIESDAERLARNREQYTLVEPTDLPQRPGQAGPNIVAYALATDNPLGEPLYQRLLFNAEQRYVENCASYASPDLAQIAFLANGGPERDKFGLDPDGDGFACAWDPTPFRMVQRSLAPAGDSN